MPGTRLATFSSRLLHPDTFALMVSPAIADLQFEADRSSGPRRLPGYLGVWRAVAGALRHDVAWRVSALISDEARRTALQSDLATFAWLLLFQVGYCLGALTLAFASWADVNAWLATVLVRATVPQVVLLLFVALLVPALPVLACFWPARHATSAD